MNKPIQFAAIIDSVTKKKDGTLSIRLGTQELGPTDTAEVFQYGNQQIWTAFSDIPMEQESINVPDDFVPEFPNEKSHSQRLREVLYVMWKQMHDDGRTQKSSRAFYEDYIEKVIMNIKEKLD